MYKMKNKNDYEIDQSKPLDKADVFLDPNELSKDGTAAKGQTSFSENGAWYAYQINEKGSDWSTIQIKNAETKQNLPEVLKWVKHSSMSWTFDHQGFFYFRYPPQQDEKEGSHKIGTKTDKAVDQKLYYHKLNTP